MEIHILVYRETELTQARRADIRHRILEAARGLVAAGGFGAVQMSDVARAADVATGTLYRHFPAKPLLFAEVFRIAAGAEVEHVRAIAEAPGEPGSRLTGAILQFTRRAARGRRLAYSLIAEPVDPAIEAERLMFRRAYDTVFRRLIQEGMDAGVFFSEDPSVASASIVGALAEALVGPLAPESGLDAEAVEARAHAMAAFCLRALAARRPAPSSQLPAS
ncbi:MAG: TetR/AcrR family transcriptional regulator [Telmatospirillum sp.]|nr:TetR/AcrR family transcriptional regulator [Telmatospirillum sp.]